jgi:hypothetical protein
MLLLNCLLRLHLPRLLQPACRLADGAVHAEVGMFECAEVDACDALQ